MSRGIAQGVTTETGTGAQQIRWNATLIVVLAMGGGDAPSRSLLRGGALGRAAASFGGTVRGGTCALFLGKR